MNMNWFELREAAEKTGVPKLTLKALVAKRPNKTPYFYPDRMADGQGDRNFFSDRDIKLILEWKEAKARYFAALKALKKGNE